MTSSVCAQPVLSPATTRTPAPCEMFFAAFLTMPSSSAKPSEMRNSK